MIKTNPDQLKCIASMTCRKTGSPVPCDNCYEEREVTIPTTKLPDDVAEAIDNISDFLAQRTDMVGYGPIIYSVHSNKNQKAANLMCKDLIALIEYATTASARVQELEKEVQELKREKYCAQCHQSYYP